MKDILQWSINTTLVVSIYDIYGESNLYNIIPAGFDPVDFRLIDPIKDIGIYYISAGPIKEVKKVSGKSSSSPKFARIIVKPSIPLIDRINQMYRSGYGWNAIVNEIKEKGILEQFNKKP